MIRPLRHAHRTLLTLLAATVPATLVTILLHRPPAASIGQSSPASTFSIDVQPEPGGRRVTITAPANRPEVLVYWAPSEVSVIDRQAVLIGRLDGAITQLAIPDDLRTGQLLLFSPPLSRIVARQALPAGATS
jgi:hypothetical protein